MAEFFAPLSDFIKLGGPVVAILVCLSIFSLAMILMRFFVFVKCRVGHYRKPRLAVKLWHEGKHDEAEKMLDGSNSAVGRSLLNGMQALNMKATKRDVEDKIAVVAARELHELQRGFTTLDAIVQIAPLLGLFGTVLGMIDAFQKLQAAGNSVDPSLLAGGIWVALLTTAAGLAVAMPVSLVLTWFETRLEDERITIQTLSSNLLENTEPAHAD